MTTKEAQEEALNLILTERGRQDRKWGEQNHDPFTYLTILMEEVGETAKAALEYKFGAGKIDDLYLEATHTAAVAMAVLECLLRDKWGWPDAANEK